VQGELATRLYLIQRQQSTYSEHCYAYYSLAPGALLPLLSQLDVHRRPALNLFVWFIQHPCQS